MALEQSGWTVFLAARDLPEQIEAAEWSQRIDEALDGAGTLVLLASPEALTKKWVTYEWRSFHNDVLADRGGWIVPCCVRGLAPDELVRALRHYQAVDLRGAQDWDAGIATALTLVEGYLKRPLKVGRSDAKPKILTIDGAGVRSIVALVFLERLETELLRVGKRLSDSFDLIVGSSFGSYFAARLAQGASVSTITDETHTMFPVAMKKRFMPLGTLYSMSELREYLDGVFGNEGLAAAANCAFSTFDMTTGQHMLWSHHPSLSTPGVSPRLADVVAASMAAPIYFKPINVTRNDGVELSLIDGSIWAAEPTRLGLDASRKMFTPRPLVGDILLISVGSGRDMTPIFKDSKQSVLSWATTLPTVLLRSNREAIDEHVKGLYRDAGALQNYIRLDPDLPTDQPWPMDGVNDVPRMRLFAQSWIESRSDLVNHAVELIASQAVGPA